MTETEFTVIPDVEIEEEAGSPVDLGGPYVVILYNDDYHTVDEVILQVMKATGCGEQRAIEITLEAHTKGRAIAYTGTQEECERVAGILRAIRLQVETDLF